MRLKDNQSNEMKCYNAGDRKRAVRAAKFKKGKYSWINKESNLNQISDG